MRRAVGLGAMRKLTGSSEEARSPLRRGRGMKMRVRGEDILRDKAVAARTASRAAHDGADGSYGFRTADDARIMELVSAQNGALREKWIGCIDAQLTVAVALRRAKGFNIDGKHVGHGIADALPDKATRQKHEAAALGVNGEPGRACMTKGFQETGVGGERVRVRLRKSASNIECVQVGGQGACMER